MRKKVLLGFTTTTGSDVDQKIEEIEKLGIKEAALFLTGKDFEERRKIYNKLKNSSLEKAPHVHIRNDFQEEELEYLEKRFKVAAYNIHDRNSRFPFYDCAKEFKNHASKIYIENTETVPEDGELEELGGLCVDFSHWEDAALLGWKKYLKQMRNKAKKYKIGCSHVSGVGADKNLDEDLMEYHSKHYFDNLREFDYLKNYLHYLPELISLELENSFKEQLEVKKHVEKTIAFNSI
ncbi:MAG: hypothetical protein U5L10_02690 [Candidatus Moranbacteria bacterium]|nr:hypothetical protein [Candidatus Moranbacteria bacterium]